MLNGTVSDVVILSGIVVCALIVAGRELHFHCETVRPTQIFEVNFSLNDVKDT